MFFKKHKELEEEEIIEDIWMINDLDIENREKDVDVSWIFLLSRVWVFKKLIKSSTLDLMPKTKKYLKYSLSRKIKLIKLKTPISDIKKVKKHKILDINTNRPKKDENTLDMMFIEWIKREVWPYGDIFIPKHSLSVRIKIYFKHFYKNIFKVKKLKLAIYFLVFLSVIFWLFFYKSLIENKANNILVKVKNFDLSQDINTTKKNIEDLKFDIVSLKLISGPIFLFNVFLNIDDIDNLKNVLNWSTNVLDSFLDFIFIYQSFQANTDSKWIENFYFWEFLKNSENIFLKAFMSLNDSILYFDEVKLSNNPQLENIFSQKLADLKKARDILKNFLENIDVIKGILWDEKKKTYMVIFQNSDELRPTWWFMWSVLLFDVFKWKLEKYEKKDIYALEWQLKPFTDPAPEWLDKITSTFWLRDANYYPNIEESSLRIKEFLDKTSLEKIDGIIYINQNIVLKFLDYFWWIYFDEVRRELNSSNFSMVTSTLVESKIYKEWTLWTPKQILFDFILVFFEKLKERWDYLSYLKIFYEWIKENEILFYSFDEKQNQFLQNIFSKNDLINTDKMDFDYPVFTSISWNKSDRYVKRTFEKRVNIDENCTINTSFEIKSKHNFNITEELNIKNFLYDMWILWDVDIKEVLNIQWKSENNQYVRIYIPENAIINNSQNYKVKVLDNRKEISFYLQTPLLFESDFKINYSIPNKDCKEYDFDFIKQPWLKNYEFNYYKNWNLINNFYNPN